MGGNLSSGRAGTLAAESIKRDGISKLPAAISIRETVVDRRRSQSDIDVWASGSFDDQTSDGRDEKGNRLPFEEVKRIYETEWSALGFEDDYQEEEYKKDGLEQLRTFYAAMMESLPEILEQEKGFELDLENNVVMKGRIDQINSLGRKDVEIVDYKTGKPRKDSDAKKDLQLSIYAIAVKEIHELNT